ncbi:Alpha-ketoglutarate-dependent dioxygenase alkB like protein 2 [Daldinia childiae]|uniref:Alpha-ketoglutarate-dependent dioxygenase alkB like protein 2 n=1 Tax=Daldinia childiae TaxID=326645 RepID=UPI0014489411|nr:Alpha-ketoglutarate-dependent dioxygenase alkB like protein 2 [Daldinia childiae]KAF3064695.1 Alpha-ketoglutarate-dependent dioxygenase alkB like protein 2 [Daldinia childiae]
MFPIDRSLLPSLTTRRALIVVDPQNDFLAKDGALPIKMPPDLPERIAGLATSLRAGGDDIIWVCSRFEKSRSSQEEQILISDRSSHSQSPDLSRGRRRPTPPQTNQQAESPEAFLTQESPSLPKCVRPGSSGVEMHPIIKGAVGPRDFSVVKTYYSAFRSEQLLRLLRMRLVTELFICGSMTNISVMATAVDAASHGYTITIVDDCCGYNSIMQHRNSIKQISKTTGCDVLFSADIIASIKPKSKPSRRPGDRPATSPAGGYSTVRRAGEEDDLAASSASDLLPSLENLSLNSQRAADIPRIKSSTKDTTPSIQPLVKPTKPTTESNRKSRASSSVAAVSEIESKPRQQKSDDDDSQKGSHTSKNNDNTQVLPQDKAQLPTQDKTIVSQQTLEETKQPGKKEESSISDSVRLKSDESDKSAEESSNPKTSLENTTESSGIVSETSSEKHPERIQGPSEISSTEVDDSRIMAPGDQSRPREGELLCEGDTKVVYDILPHPVSEDIFERVRDEVQWQRMSHQGGEVPRLVAVQGQVDEDGSMPIYRHPSDESPPLLPFSPAVLEIKKVVEKQLGHPLNHVLIQFYRDGNDYISEHSDKTLDISKDSFIANVSLGAERTMTLRTKRQPRNKNSVDAEPLPTIKRQVQRARLPHNSLFQMGLQTNMRWLHGIRQDKRIKREKSDAELAYDGGRISLTFRRIGTFLDRENKLIWGQGATSKTREGAKNVINGQTPEAIKMLQGFGRENQSTEFNWEEYYGIGFDVLHLSTAPRLFLSSDPVVNMRIQLMLAEYGVSYARGSMSPLFKWKPTNDPFVIPKDLPIKFVDNDSPKTTVEGESSIMLYLEHFYDPKAGSNPSRDFVKEGTRFQQGIALLKKHETLKAELGTWENYAAEGNDFIAGPTMTLADFAFWPVLYDIIRVQGQDVFEQDGAEFENLKKYYERIEALDSVKKVIAVSATCSPKKSTDAPGATVPT